ncbi:MAG: hypothetical protein P4L43_08255 [Syntrophobacteraceae bacterium]|nr:hypothetical protein [Syntrophobacteraceae bacterium]
MKKTLLAVLFLSVLFIAPTASMAGVGFSVGIYGACPTCGGYYYSAPPVYRYYVAPAPVRVYGYYGGYGGSYYRHSYYRSYERHCYRHRHHENWDDRD